MSKPSPSLAMLNTTEVPQGWETMPGPGSDPWRNTPHPALTGPGDKWGSGSTAPVNMLWESERITARLCTSTPWHIKRPV